MKVVVPFYYCQYDLHKNSLDRVDQDSFVNCVRRASLFVRVKPSELILREVFKRADIKRKGYLDQSQYVNTLGSILESYKFDTRGLGQSY